MKAINDAAAKNKNSRIIAVFVPVLQNSKEFEDLPVDETITISSDSIPESHEDLQENNIISGIPDENLTPEPLEVVQEEEQESEPTPEPESEPAPEIESITEEFSQDEPVNELDNLVFEEIEEYDENESEPELVTPEENENLQEIPEELEAESALETLETIQEESAAPLIPEVEEDTPEEVIILEEPSHDDNEIESESEELAPISILDETDDSDELPDIKPLDNLDGLEESITEEPVLILPADEVTEIEESTPAPSEEIKSSESESPESPESQKESPEIAELEEVELKAPDLEGDEIEILLDSPEEDESGEKIKVE